MPQPLKVTEDVAEEMIEMANAGQPITAIAEEFEVSDSTVRRTLKRYRVTTRRQHTLMDVVDTPNIIKQYTSWQPINEILREHDINRSQLYYILRKQEVEPRTQDKEWQEAQEMRVTHAIQLYKDGHPLAYITEETGVHQPQLHEELARKNVPLRRPQPKSLPTTEEVKERINDAIN